MDLLNATGMQAGYTLGVEPSGREHLVVAVKGTFAIPQDGAAPELAEAQQPLVEADVFTGEPGLSAPLYETDYPLRKARCDVLLNGSAYAPGGRPAARVPVALMVGALAKTFEVVGDRVWYGAGANVQASAPRPFEVMPVGYDRAFGGVDDADPDPAKHDAYMANPVGRGFHRNLAKAYVEHQLLPNSEERDKPVAKPDRAYKPMAFGPLGRGWQPRLRYAGTYDQRWLDETFPFLPKDFHEAYYQAAPADQQIPHPKGGEPVRLINLTPEGRCDFALPRLEVPIVFFPRDGAPEPAEPVIDTVVIEPDQGRFTVTWRASRPLKRNIFEVVQVLAGRMSRAWWRARTLGKSYHPGLGALIRTKRAEAREEAGAP